MTIRIDDPAACLERLNNEPVDVVKQLLRHILAPGRGQVQFQRFKRPLAAMLRIVIVGILLNRDIGQVDKEIVQVIGRLIVSNRTKPAKPHFVHVRLQRAKRSDKDINAQVKLFAANQQRVSNVATDYIRVLRRWWGDRALCAPLFQLARF